MCKRRYYIRYKLKSSVKKLYFSACANGELEKLEKLVIEYPQLLPMVNDKGRSTYDAKNGLYYSIKNLKYSTTDYLLSKGLKISARELRNLIYFWNGSFKSFTFIQHYGDSIYLEPLSTEFAYGGDLVLLYKSHCLGNNKIPDLIKILGIDITNKEGLISIINEYKLYKKNNTSPNYLHTVRDLQLKYLCD